MRDATLYEIHQAIASAPQKRERRGNQVITTVNVLAALIALLEMERMDDCTK